MPTFTLYVATADLTTLNAIFNGVAMICKQTAFIWGFAMLASMWTILATVTKAPIAAVSGKADGVLPTGSLSAIMPFIMAMLLTMPGFQGNIQVESTVNGQVTVISNVPIIISAIPATGSILAQQAGGLVETAFQSTGTDYASISATGTGFINPLKVLLASRSAVNRLNGVASQVDSVITFCLAPDSGVDYSSVTALVSNAGNSGASSTLSIPINGANPTALGALLYQASLQNAFVPTITTTDGSILDCTDAAYTVASNLGDALESTEFSRIVQGAVNGMDQPSIPANTTIDQITQQWSATRNANTVTGAVAVGSQQAQNEVINLLTAELTSNELACLNTSNESRTICESSLIQSNELERYNIQLAAAEVPMLKYAGSFANYLLALIIGLGPIVVMFMMFAGVNAGKCLKTVAHLIAWPLLVTNVGAELINGMIYISIANFSQGIAAGGVISLAENVAIYKELSFQIGSASHMMASLPVIMGMIFALGESAALVNVGSNLGPKSGAVEDSASPFLVKQDAMVASSSMAKVDHTTQGAVSTLNGAFPAISASSQEGQFIAKSSSAISHADSVIKTQQESESAAKSNAKTVNSQTFKDWGFTDAQSKAFREHLSVSKRNSVNDHAGERNSSSSLNESSGQTSAGFSIGGGVGWGGNKNGLSIGANAGATSAASSRNSLSNDINSGHEQVVNQAKETGATLEDARNFANTHGFGGRVSGELTKRIDAQNSYTQSLVSNESATDTQSKALESSASATSYAAKINDLEFEHQSAPDVNPELSSFMNVEGHRLQGLDSVQKNLAIARKDADRTGTSDIRGDEHGRERFLMFRAAQITAQDQSAPVAERYEAQKFVTSAMTHMMHGGVEPSRIEAPKTISERPENKTGNLLPSEAVPPTTKSTTASTTPKHKSPHISAPPTSTHSTTSPNSHSESSADLQVAFNKDFTKPLEPNFDPKGKASSMAAYARTQYLGPNHTGAVVRTATTVASLADNIGKEQGSQDATNYGQGGVVENRVNAEKNARIEAERKDKKLHPYTSGPMPTPGELSD